MIIKLLIVVAIIAFVLLGVAVTEFLEKKKWLPKRYITGCLVFLIILVPSMFFPQLPLIVKQFLYGCSALLAVIFFDTSRRLLESGKYRGIVDPSLNKKEK